MLNANEKESEKIKVLMALMGLNIGGAETHVVELCKELKKRGYEVLVASNGGVYEKELEQNRITHFKVPMHNKNINNLLKSYFMLKEIIIKNNIKLVHAHARIPAFLCGLLRKKLKFKFLTTAHWIFKSYFPFNILTDWGESTLAVSKDISDYLVSKYNLSDSRIYVTVNGIDTEKFSGACECDSLLKELGLNKNKKHIVCVSRLDRDRSLAVHRLLDVAEDFNDTEIIIVGDGNDMAQIKQKTDLINQKQKIVWLAGARTDINKFLALADIFVGVSRAALEAMAAKVPVILAGNEGYIGILKKDNIKDAIDTNFCCRGHEKISSDKLKNDIKKLLDLDKNNLESLAEFGYQTVQNFYSVKKMADDAIEVYNQLQSEEKEIDVMVSGYYGFKNNGDDTVLRSMVTDLKEKHLRITVLSMRPWETKKIYGVNSINRFDFFKISKYLSKTNLLISGGGSLIQDITSTHSLRYYLWIIKTALKKSVPVMLYANGIGPVVRKKNRRLVKKILNQVDVITLRDQKSKSELVKLKVNKPKILVTADPAFNLKFNLNNNLPFGLSKEKKYFVVAVRNWRYNIRRFEKLIATFADHVYDIYKFLPVFVPMHPTNDYSISRKIVSMIKTDAKFIDVNYTTDDLLNLINRAEFVVGMRLHTIIYAIKTATPAIAIVYDPKVKAIMQETGQDTFIDIKKFNLEDMERFIYEVINYRQTISHKLKLKYDVLKKLAKQNSNIVFEILDKTIHQEINI